MTFIILIITISFTISWDGSPERDANSYTFLAFSSFLFIGGLIVMLYKSPEVILITDVALFRAKRLHHHIEENYNKELISEPDNEVVKYIVELKEYLDSIPEDVRLQLNSN